MQSQDPAKELFSISSRDEHKSTLQTLSLKFDRVVFPINKYQMHWAVAVLWAGNNVNNEANATEVCTDDSSGTNSQKPITVVNSFNEEIHRPTTSCDRHWATNRYPKGRDAVRTNRTVSSAGFDLLEHGKAPRGARRRCHRVRLLFGREIDI
jgi:hypothetical protein